MFGPTYFSKKVRKLKKSQFNVVKKKVQVASFNKCFEKDTKSNILNKQKTKATSNLLKSKTIVRFLKM